MAASAVAVLWRDRPVPLRGSRLFPGVAQPFSFGGILDDLCYMNCFRHPNETALVFCKGCNKPLCWECSQQTFDDQTHVCSEECARTVSQQPDPWKLGDSIFDKVYATVFLTVLLAVLGGGLCVWRGQYAIACEKDRVRREKEGLPAHTEGKLSLPFNLFYSLNITDWRIQFGIGAAGGAGSALLFMAKFLINDKADK